VRYLFALESVLASDWYAARLDAKQRADAARSARGAAALGDFLRRPNNADVIARLGLAERHARTLVEQARVHSAAYRAGSWVRSGCNRSRKRTRSRSVRRPQKRVRVERNGGAYPRSDDAGADGLQLYGGDRDRGHRDADSLRKAAIAIVDKAKWSDQKAPRRFVPVFDEVGRPHSQSEPALDNTSGAAYVVSQEGGEVS